MRAERGCYEDLRTVGEHGPELFIPGADGYVTRPPPPPDRGPRFAYVSPPIAVWVPLACSVVAGIVYATLIAVLF